MLKASTGLGFSVGFRRGGDHDVHAPVFVDFIEIDFREHDVLFHAHGIVATAIKRFARIRRGSRGYGALRW